jgi:hypothetical protein
MAHNDDPRPLLEEATGQTTTPVFEATATTPVFEATATTPVFDATATTPVFETVVPTKRKREDGGEADENPLYPGRVAFMDLPSERDWMQIFRNRPEPSDMRARESAIDVLHRMALPVMKDVEDLERRLALTEKENARLQKEK